MITLFCYVSCISGRRFYDSDGLDAQVDEKNGIRYTNVPVVSYAEYNGHTYDTLFPITARENHLHI